jgi:hypothetical protein
MRFRSKFNSQKLLNTSLHLFDKMRLNIIFLAILVIFLIESVSAADVICASAQITDINPVILEANEDFIVGIQIDNCGEIIPENITFQITRHSPDIAIKDPLVTYIDRLGFSNSKRFITYHLRTSASPIPGEHVFEAKLTYGKGDLTLTENYSFSVFVESDAPELVLSGIKTNPDRINPDQDVILTLKVQNSGDGTAKDVRVKLENLDFQGVKDTFLGEMSPKDELPARFVLRSNDIGEKDFIIKVYYTFAGENIVEQFPASIQVFEQNKNDLYWIIPLALVGLVIAIAIIRKAWSGKEDEEN